MSALTRGPDKYARQDIRERVRRAKYGVIGGTLVLDDASRLDVAMALMEEVSGLCDRLDDAEALLEGGGR